MNKEAKAEIALIKKRIREFDPITPDNARDALVWEMKLINRYHIPYWLYVITRCIQFTKEEVKKMTGEAADASSLFLAGCLRFWGIGGVRNDWRAAYELWVRASNKGHVYATFMRAHCFEHGLGVAQDRDEAKCFYREASTKGCGRAFARVGDDFYTTGDYRIAANMYARSVSQGYDNCRHSLNNLLRDHPLECCPFSEWRPTLEVQLTVPKRIHTAMYTSAVILRTRFSMPRYVVNLVMFFICTRNGW